MVLDVPIKLLVLVLGIVKTVHEYCNWILLRTHQKLVLVLGIVKASLEILGIGIGVKKWSAVDHDFLFKEEASHVHDAY